MPKVKVLEEALIKSFGKRKKQGKLKDVSEGQYVFGSKVMKNAMKKKKGHEGGESFKFEKGEK